MTATPPCPNAKSQLGKAAGAAGVALGALVAVAVAALFVLVTGANRSNWPSPRQAHDTGANPRAIRAAWPPRATRQPSHRRRSRFGTNQAPRTPQNKRHCHDNDKQRDPGCAFVSRAVTDIGAVISAAPLTVDDRLVLGRATAQAHHSGRNTSATLQLRSGPTGALRGRGPTRMLAHPRSGQPGPR